MFLRKLCSGIVVILFIVLFQLFNSSCLFANSENSSTLENHSQFSSHTFYQNKDRFPDEVKYYSSLGNGTAFVTESADLVYSLNLDDGKIWAFKETFLSSNNENRYCLPIENINAASNNEMMNCHDQLLYKDIWMGIDLRLISKTDNIEKVFVVNPDYFPENIKIVLDGIDYLYINEVGELVIRNGAEESRFTSPIAYQMINGEKKSIAVEYTCVNFSYGFSTSEYDHSYPLIIDPMLASTFLGGSRADDQYEPSMIFSSDGNIIVTGYTSSNNFPTTLGVFDPDYSNNNTERFVTIMTPDLSTIIASTFVGGPGNEFGMGLCTDDDGSIYVAGYTNWLEGFPQAENGYVSETTGGLDAFILKLSSDLSTLLGSAIIGGSADEGFQWPRINVEVGQNGDVYIVGLTKSDDFPFTEGALDSTYAGGIPPYFGGGDAFLAKFSSDLTTLLASTYIGGTGDEWRVSMTLDEDDNIYITGDTCNGDYPVTDGAYDTSYNAYGPGYYDMFVTKINSDLTSIIASTFIGSLGGDDPLCIKLDPDGNIFLAGFTTYNNFPTTTGAYSRTFHGVQDIVVLKFNNDLSELLASTLIGGNDMDTGEDIAISDDGSVYVSGFTASSDFPIVNFLETYDFSHNGGKDVILLKMDNDLTTLEASTFIGGSNDDRGQHILLNDAGEVIVVGRTESNNFPVLEGSYDNTYNGGVNDCFLFKMDADLSGDLNKVDEENGLPVRMNLLESYPNPFNSMLNLKYQIATDCNVELNIFDLNGRNIIKVTNNFHSAGEYTDSIDFSSYATGTYFVRLKTNSATITNKVMYVK